MGVIIDIHIFSFIVGFFIGLIIGFLSGCAICVYMDFLEQKQKKRKLKGYKEYIVIELAEGYNCLYGYKIFDNYDDAYNFYKWRI